MLCHHGLTGVYYNDEIKGDHRIIGNEGQLYIKDMLTGFGELYA